MVYHLLEIIFCYENRLSFETVCYEIEIKIILLFCNITFFLTKSYKTLQIFPPNLNLNYNRDMKVVNIIYSSTNIKYFKIIVV